MSVLYLSVFIFWHFFAFTPYILTQISEFSIPFLKTGSCLKAAFAFFGCAPDDLQTQNVAICDILAMRLNNQLIFWWIKEQLGQIILILLLHYIKMIWGSISWKKCLQRKNFLLWYSEYISEPAFYYFYLSKEVESVLLLSPESFFTQVSVLPLKGKNVCTFATSDGDNVNQVSCLLFTILVNQKNKKKQFDIMIKLKCHQRYCIIYRT